MGLIFRLFRLFATGNFRGLFTVLLGLTLVLGLWETSLVRLSSRDTATAIMTEVGVDFLNPLLNNNSLGLTQTLYTNLKTAAQTHPTQTLTVPGLKIHIQASDIVATKSLGDALRVIYAQVANAYYDNGLQGVLDVPSQITSVLGQFSQLTQAAASQGASSAGVPPQLTQLTQVLLPPLGAIGLSPMLFTAQGHAAALNLQKWILGAAAIFALLLMIFSPRLHRISSVAWSVLTGALPGVIVLGIVWFFWGRNASALQSYQHLRDLVGGAFVPVYGGAFAVGAGGLVLAKVGDLALRGAGVGRRAPAGAGAFSAQRPAASAGFGGYGQAPLSQQPETPRLRPYASGSGSAGAAAARAPEATWDMPPVGTPQRQPGAPYSPPGYGGSSSGQSGQGWPGAAGAQGAWGQPGQAQGGWNPPAQSGWGQPQSQPGGWGQPGQGGQAAWPPAQPDWPPSGAGDGQPGQVSQGGWGNQPQPGPGQPGSGQAGPGRPPAQSGPSGGLGQQRGGWPPANDDDPWAPRR